MAEETKTLYSWDIQKEVYLKGEDKLNVPLDTKDYDFEFDRFYALHQGETKKYKFVAVLNDNIAQMEAAAGRPVMQKTSQGKNVDFKWNQADEIWHIEMLKDNYAKIAYKIYTADDNGEPTNPDCTIYHEEGKVDDYYGKNRIYFIKDIGLDMVPLLDKLDSNEDNMGAINEVILGIRELIPEIEKKGISKDKMQEAGFYPEEYGVK